MASDVSIINLALIKAGAKTITDLNEKNPRAIVAKLSYPLARDVTLQSFPWNFADRRVKLTEQVTKPEFGFEHQYALPNDPQSLHVIQVNTRKRKFKVEGQLILTDEESPIEVLYTSLVTDPNFFTPTFIGSLVLLLGSDFATSLMKNQKLSESLLAQFVVSLKNAKRADSQEGTTDSLTRDRSLLDVRRGVGIGINTN